MPIAILWSAPRDAQLRRLRAEGESWETIARAFGVSRNCVLERGRRIGAPRPPVPPPGANSLARAEPGRHEPGRHEPGRAPLPAGHEVTWGAITNSTLLADTPYPAWALDVPPAAATRAANAAGAASPPAQRPALPAARAA